MPLNYEQAKGWLAGGLQEARASQPWTNNPGFTPGLFVNGRSSMPFTDLVFNDIPSPDEGRKAAESEQSPERTARKPKGDIDRQNEIEFLDNPLRDGITLLKSEHGIQSLDLVIANAGICDTWGPVAKISEDEMLKHFEVNTLGLLRLFKATIPLLNAAEKPKLVYISTRVASISRLSTWSATTEYGVSKIAGNFLVKMISIEHSNVVAFSIDPGFVQTDMGNRGAKAQGLEKAPVTVEDSTSGIIKQIDAASQEITGRFLGLDGGEIPW
ncbi:hypothetical protein TrVFT333_002128 [Trichoderma virens FT-333]|nr:hypothetical protein TrVFT333_002128 [Trichoderma virens FT-333]